MHIFLVIHILGFLLIFLSGAMLLPIPFSLHYGEGDYVYFLITALITFVTGFAAFKLTRLDQDLRAREGFAIVTFGWIAFSLLGCLPFILSGAIPSLTDAFFETMSGFTTTGATILEDIESLSHGLLFWRSFTHWLGGMGIIVLSIAILPFLGVGGMQLFKAEVPGPAPDKLTPRVTQTAKILWGVYILISLVETLLLMLGGMNLFEALCHTFGTMATGGFSTKNASIGHYNSAYVDWVTTLFMFLGGVSFVLLYQLLRGDTKALQINTEFRWYVGFLLFFCGSVSLILWHNGTYSTIADSFRYGTFQVMSLLTTTGFATADYELWPQSAQMLLYTVCFIGACAGSTTSGIKVIHYTILCKFMYQTIRKIFFQPMAVVSVRLNGKAVDNNIINLAICYFIINMFMIFIGGFIMTLTDNLDYGTAMSTVIATLMNIGPGFGLIGPTENYAFISDAGKWFLSWNMLVGRLEMFSALVIFYPSFWEN